MWGVSIWCIDVVYADQNLFEREIKEKFEKNEMKPTLQMLNVDPSTWLS